MDTRRLIVDLGVAMVFSFLAAAGTGHPFAPTPARAQAPADGARGLYEQHCQKCHAKDGSGAPARGLYPDIPDFRNNDWQERRTDAQLSTSILDGKGADMPPTRGKINAEQARGLVTHVRSLAPTRDRKEPEKKKTPAAPSDFDKEWSRLQKELDQLEKQSRDLARESAKKDRPRPSEPTPPSKSFVEKAPIDKSPVEKAPIKKSPLGKPPVEKLPVEKVNLEPQASSVPSATSRTAAAGIRSPYGLFKEHCQKCHGEDGSGSAARGRLPSVPNFADAAWQARLGDTQLLTSILNGKGKEMPPARTKISEKQARRLVGYVRMFAPETEGSEKEEQEQPTSESLPAHEDTTNFRQITHWLGKFHGAAVHFPIALLTAAAVAELFLMTTGKPMFQPAGRFCVWGAAGTAVVAGTLGWFLGGFQMNDSSAVMGAHRLLGTCTVVLAASLPLLSETSQSGHSRLGFRAMLLVSVCVVLVTGFLGGALVYGLDHYDWP
jgi:mono/diheme cytochrome c family protein/uncharacterized membrane protein